MERIGGIWMMGMWSRGGLVLGVFLLGTTLVPADEKISERLSAVLRTRGEEGLAVWVTFTDKGTRELQKASISLDVISKRSLERRKNVLPPDQLVDYTDLPVEGLYIEELTAAGAMVRQRSKWLNAVSLTAIPSVIHTLAALPFVHCIDLVGRFKKDSSKELVTEDVKWPAQAPLAKNDASNVFEYGPSLAQVSLLNIPSVHNTGNYAQGVIIGVFDTGFLLLTHEAFDSLKVIATYDFVDKKVSVVPNNPAPLFEDHGINTLSTLAGFKPGKLIGPAFGATYILARTEDNRSETPIEEDNWVAAIEWAESLGVQVTSTSLGYLTYDTPYVSWTWEDMDGRTTMITKAAAMAVRKGVVVVNAAGNEGISADPTHNTLNAPADGDSVLAIGNVAPSGARYVTSSVGPTTSVPPRIKPDLMATGTSVVCASPTGRTAYTSAQGTSFSCPLAAGIAAMILRDYPSATPAEVAEALKMTASNAASPNNRYGWGIINAMGALDYWRTFQPRTTPAISTLGQNFPNPFNPSTTIPYELTDESTVSLKIYDILGREVRTLAYGTQPGGRYFAYWSGEDSRGGLVGSGVFFIRLDATAISGTRTVVTRKIVRVR
jgi:subtilisin family serine protease